MKTVQIKRTLHLNRLHCYLVEENEYDEVFLKYQGKRIWPKNKKWQAIIMDTTTELEVEIGGVEKYQDVDYVDGDNNVIPQPIKNDMKALHEFTNDTSVLDVTNRLKLNSQGVIVFNFGKYIGQPVKEILARDRQYYNWILDKDFSHQVKKIVRKIVQDIEKDRRSNG